MYNAIILGLRQAEGKEIGIYARYVEDLYIYLLDERNLTSPWLSCMLSALLSSEYRNLEQSSVLGLPRFVSQL